jgi:hypothetical protein
MWKQFDLLQAYPSRIAHPSRDKLSVSVQIRSVHRYTDLLGQDLLSHINPTLKRPSSENVAYPCYLVKPAPSNSFLTQFNCLTMLESIYIRRTTSVPEPSSLPRFGGTIFTAVRRAILLICSLTESRFAWGPRSRRYFLSVEGYKLGVLTRFRGSGVLLRCGCLQNPTSLI